MDDPHHYVLFSLIYIRPVIIHWVSFIFKYIPDIGGLSFKYARRIFWKTNISNPQIRTYTSAYRGVEMLVFRKILRSFLMDDT